MPEAALRDIDHLVTVDQSGTSGFEAGREQPRKGANRDRLPAPGLSNHAERLATGHLEAGVEGEGFEVIPAPGTHAQAREAHRGGGDGASCFWDAHRAPDLIEIVV